MCHHEPKAKVMVDYPNASALDWSEVVKLLTNPSGTCWLSTVSGEGQVHRMRRAFATAVSQVR